MEDKAVSRMIGMHALECGVEVARNKISGLLESFSDHYHDGEVNPEPTHDGFSSARKIKRRRTTQLFSRQVVTWQDTWHILVPLLTLFLRVQMLYFTLFSFICVILYGIWYIVSSLFWVLFLYWNLLHLANRFCFLRMPFTLSLSIH